MGSADAWRKAKGLRYILLKSVDTYNSNCFHVSGGGLDLNEWMEAFKALHYRTYGKTAWNPNSLIKEPNGYWRGRGWRVSRIPLGVADGALLLNPAYPVFSDPKKDPLPEVIAGGTNPALTDPISWVEVCDVADKLSEVSKKNLIGINAKLLSDCSLKIDRVYGGEMVCPVTSKTNANDQPFLKSQAIGLIATGYNPTPHRSTIIEAAQNLRSQLQMRRCECRLSYSLPAIDSLLEQVKKNSEARLRSIVFLGLEGSHGDQVSQEILAILSDLEREKVPYQIFSYRRWRTFSAYSLCSSVCLKTGGLPFRVTGSGILDSENPILVGVDKSHNRMHRISTYSITALNKDGVILFRDTWTTIRDETFRDPDTDRAVKSLGKFLKTARLDDRPLIVMRDGRMFKNESLKPWERLISKQRLTYLEIIKNPTPILYSKHEAQAPLVTLEGCNDGFLCPVWKRKTGQGHTRRIRIKRNPNKYSMQQIAEFLAATCYQPRLGPHPTLHPTPIYWADGFASASDTQLKFRGFL